MNTNPSTKATAVVLILLFVLAIAGFAGCIAFGADKHNYFQIANTTSENSSFEVVADSGLNGGAIGCGIFGAVALFGFVKVFLARTN